MIKRLVSHLKRRLWSREQTANTPSANPTPPESAALARALQNCDSVFFVQIGSNDGLQGDPIHSLAASNPGWRGLLVEPVPYLFQRLQANYEHIDPRGERFVFECMAIAEKKGSKTFYYVSEQARIELGNELPFWFDQLGSFDRGHIQRHLDGRLEPYIIEEQLPCAPLPDVLAHNHIKHIDLLHIDTEGYDLQVLRQFDLARFRPRVILCEHIHLNPDERKEMIERLRQHGYEVETLGFDYLARLV